MARSEPRFYLKISLVIMAFFVIAGYSYFRAKDLLTGPEIQIFEPANGQSFKSPDITIDGKTKNISFLSLNGRQIYTDDSGNFSRKLLLSKGYNIITVAAKDKFNRTIEKSVQLTYEPDLSTTDGSDMSSTTTPY